MDGVLINTEPLHYQCWVEIFKERYGIDLDYDVYKPCIGSTRLHFMNLIKENYGITFESLEVMNQIMKEKKDEIIARDGFPEMPGVGQMLCCLKDAGYRLAVASSSPKPVITETLETLDLMKYFDVVTSGDEVKNPKPAPDTFLFAAKQLGVPVDECIVKKIQRMEERLLRRLRCHVSGCIIRIPETRRYRMQCSRLPPGQRRI